MPTASLILGGRWVGPVAWVAAALVQFLVPARASPADAAASGTEPSSRYAFRAEVRLTADPSRDRLEVGAANGVPPLSACTVEVAAQARDAYDADLRAAFGPASADKPGVLVEVSIRSASVVPGGETGRASVEHTVAIRGPAGQEIARFEVGGESPILGSSPDAVQSAFARAAARAARYFSQTLDASVPVGAWLTERGLARAVRPSLPSEFVRGRLVSFVDAGGGVADLEAPGWVARAGVSGERFMLSATMQKVYTSFPATPVFAPTPTSAELEAILLGADLGVVGRLGNFEGCAGVGAQWAGGPARVRYQRYPRDEVRRMTIDGRAMRYSTFAAVQGTSKPWTRWGLRGRLGIEVRLFVGGRISYDAYGAENTLVPRTLVGFTVGFEVPLLR